MTYLIELTAPTDVDAPANWSVQAWTQMASRNSFDILGTHDMDLTVADVIVHFRSTPYARKILVALLDGECPAGSKVGELGLAEVSMDDLAWPHSELLGLVKGHVPLRENLGLFYGVSLSVAPTAPEGSAARLLAEVDRLARHFGRDTASGFVQQRLDTSGSTVVSADGNSEVALDERSQPFVDAGYELVQVSRQSKLDLPVADDVLAACQARVGADFVVDFLTGSVPTSDREGMRLLLARLEFDAPTEGLDFDLPTWDDERLKLWESRTWSDTEHTIVAVARERMKGTIVGYSELIVPLDKENIVFQGGTLVSPEFRGNGLGWGVKAAALRQLAVEFPTRTYVSTWNATTNPWMLAINEFLGFQPWSVGGEWLKKYPA